MNNMDSDKCCDKQIIKKGLILCLFLSTTLLIDTTQAQWVFDDRPDCTTPDGASGTCILANSCRPIVDFITRNQPLSASTLRILRAYQCGFDGNSVKVCCPSGPIQIGGTTSSRPVTQRPNTGGAPPPPDVSRHRNFGLLPTSCGYYSIDDRLLNGNKTGVFEFPWMVLISYQTNKGPDFRCGGTLISKRYVLTAAHCISTNLKILGVRIGEHDTRTPIDCNPSFIPGSEPECAPAPQDIGIEEAIAHPSWNNPAYSNDVGLLRLASDADLTPESVKPICLPISTANRNYNFFNGRNVTVTGWGSTETARNSPDLLKVNIPVINHDRCAQIFQRQVNITFQQVCAGGVNRTDSCSGDSGGPLQTVLEVNTRLRYVQLGIVSFGPKICGSNPGVYTKVAYYMDWILNTMRP